MTDAEIYVAHSLFVFNLKHNSVKYKYTIRSTIRNESNIQHSSNIGLRN